MHRESKSIAIVLFAREADAESHIKPLISSTQKNASLHKELFDWTLATVKSLEIPVFHFGSHNQEGQTFGIRISNAISSVFEKGFANVLVVGGDCPEMKISDLHQAVNSIKQNPFIVGPNYRGGAYLLGFSKELFHAQKVADLSWCSATLIDDLKEYSKAHFLKKRRDVNFTSDLILVRSSWFRRLLLMLLKFPLIPPTYIRISIASTIQPIGRRGPPLLS